MILERILASIDILGEDGVERLEQGKAPVAFRIWKFGENPTDKGQTIFSRRSAEMLMKAQKLRGNLVSMDVDHLSLNHVAPPESRKAIGWHKLEVRKDGLWAVDVEWTAAVKAGLEADPPEWRYFSPAYDVEKKSREVVAYLNTALTNNPATWQVSALATSVGSEGTNLTLEDIRAALKAMSEGEDEECKMKAGKMLAALDDDVQAPAEQKEEAAAGDEPAPDSEKPGPGLERELDEDAIAATLAVNVQKLTQKVELLEERSEREQLLASRGDLAPSVKAWLQKQTVATIKGFLKAAPQAKPKAAQAPVTITATRGEGQTGDGDPAIRTGRLPAAEREELDRRMGLAVAKPAIQRVGNTVQFGAMTQEEARRVLASRNKKEEVR